MSDSMLEYYQKYYVQGGSYSLTAVGETSRVLQVKEWLSTRLKANARVLDVGCGDMGFSKHLPQFDNDSFR